MDVLVVCVHSVAVCFRTCALRERGESSPTASPCDMSDPSLPSLQHEQGKKSSAESALVSSLWYPDLFPGCVMSFHVGRRWLLLRLREAFERWESCVIPECRVYRQAHRSCWPLCGCIVLWRCDLCLQRPLSRRNVGCSDSCLDTNIGRLRLWNQTTWV